MIYYEELEIIHRVNRKLKHCYITIERDGSVVLKSFGIHESEALEMISQRAAWIRRKLECHHKRERQQFQLGIEVGYLGEVHSLQDNPEFDDLLAAIQRLRSSGEEGLQRCYDAFYKRRAADYIPERLQHLERSHGVSASALRIRKMRRRWGSCSSKGVITVNSSLMRLPTPLIDYILIHELAHLKQMNHSRAFYEEVARMLPEHRALEAQLKGYQFV